MAKLEELAELLTEEIHGFNKSIHRLEELSECLGDIQVKADATNIEQLLQKYLHKQQENLSDQSGKLDKVYETVEGTYLFPRWIVITFYTCIGITLISVATAIIFKIQKKEALTWHIRHYNSFFKDTLEAKKLYQEWADKENNQTK